MPDAASGRDRDTGQRQGDGATLALENAQLRVDLARREQLGEVTAAIVASITAVGELHEVMTRVAALAGEAIGADWAYIALLKGGVWMPSYLWQTPAGFGDQGFSSEQTPFADRALRAGEPVTIDDCAGDESLDATLCSAWGARAVMVAPMVVRREVLGGLFFRYDRPHRFSRSDLAFAKGVAGAASQALHAARLLEQQRRIAVTLQENLIHPLPVVAGLEYAVVGSTAYEAELVGGDFSDVFLVDGRHVAILIGDVAGKGIRAAGLTETVRSTVRAFATVDTSPAAILRMTNQLLLRRGIEEELVTALLVSLDPLSGRARFASAAHPPPVLVGARSCRLLELPFGVPLGSFDLDYEDVEARLAPSDGLVLYTDGVTEAHRGAELFGYERLLATVSALGGGSATALAEGVRDAAVGFADRLKDDLHVVALRLVGERLPA
jgi:serine phosphatase RsbU (regulator of sigma subunit)